MPDEESTGADQLTMASVLDHYGADTHRCKSRGWSTIRCPFHDDSHPTARVRLDSKSHFWCPVCGISADAIGLIMDREGLDYSAANEWAREALGSSHSRVRESDSRPERKRWRNTLFD